MRILNNPFSKNITMKIFIAFFLLLSAHCNAAKIYKWTDENGKIHYSSTPPVAQETKAMGNTNNKIDAQSADVTKSKSCKGASKSELLEGVWSFNKNKSRAKNKKILFRFYNRWSFGQASGKPIPKHFIDIGQYNSQSGKWTVSGSMLIFTVGKMGKAHSEFKIIRKARIHKINTRELYLLINDTDPMKFTRDISSGVKPKCMRRKRRR